MVRHDACPSDSRQSRYTQACIYVHGVWRSPGSLLCPLDGFLRGNGECRRGSLAGAARERAPINVGLARRPRRPRNPCNFASSARAGLHRAGSPKMAGTRVRVLLLWWWWRDGGPLGGRSIRPPPNTGHGGYRCRASPSRVLRVNPSRQVWASRSPTHDRPPRWDDKRGRDRVRGAWCSESVAEAVASPQTRSGPI